MTDPDWTVLRAAAIAAAAHAYAPYSKLKVGAAAITETGRIITGCNVESASFGLTLCAECGLISSLHSSGGGRLVALSCMSDQGDLLSPCGRCRQLLMEHAGPQLLVDSPQGPLAMSALLPYAFGPGELP